jgi:hypothetical protein
MLGEKKDKKGKQETKLGNFEKLPLWQELRKNGGGREPPRKRPNSEPPNSMVSLGWIQEV